MFGWLRKKDEPPLVFPDNRAAFDYACIHMDYPLLLGAVIPALVEEEGKPGDEGEHHFQLRLASRQGGIEVWASTLKEATAFPRVGDLVGFRIVTIASDLPPGMNLIGFIAFQFEPVLVKDKGWRIARNLTPADIKPELHL
jgi:hypothetical protein